MADTSSWVAYFSGEKGKDVEALDQALAQKVLFMCPVVLTELLSAPGLKQDVKDHLNQLPLLEIHEGFWERAGLGRAKILKKRLKVRLGDALIAQSILDHHCTLITRDRDFRHFEKHAGLKVIWK